MKQSYISCRPFRRTPFIVSDKLIVCWLTLIPEESLAIVSVLSSVPCLFQAFMEKGKVSAQWRDADSVGCFRHRLCRSLDIVSYLITDAVSSPTLFARCYVCWLRSTVFASKWCLQSHNISNQSIYLHVMPCTLSVNRHKKKLWISRMLLCSDINDLYITHFFFWSSTPVPSAYVSISKLIFFPSTPFAVLLTHSILLLTFRFYLLLFLIVLFLLLIEFPVLSFLLCFFLYIIWGAYSCFLHLKGWISRNHGTISCEHLTIYF